MLSYHRLERTLLGPLDASIVLDVRDEGQHLHHCYCLTYSVIPRGISSQL